MEEGDVDCERWLNELTHKYLAIVHLAHKHCWHTRSFQRLRAEYERLCYGLENASLYFNGDQIPRKRSRAILTVEYLAQFSDHIQEIKAELDAFVLLSQ